MVAVMPQLLAKFFVGCVMACEPLGRVTMEALAPMTRSPRVSTIGTLPGGGGVGGGGGLGGGGGGGRGGGGGGGGDLVTAGFGPALTASTSASRLSARIVRGSVIELRQRAEARADAWLKHEEPPMGDPNSVARRL